MEHSSTKSNSTPGDSLDSVLTVNYGDGLSTLFVWQKAFSLAPLWALPLIPLYGFAVLHLFGEASADYALGLMICAFMAYFLEDLLKRRIRFDKSGVYFGFKYIPMQDVAGVDVIYKRKKFLPSHLAIVASSGRKLNLALSALSDQSVRDIVQYLRKRNPDLTVVPALNALARVKAKKSNALDTNRALEISYETNRLLPDLIDTFKGAAASWIRVGPILVAILLGTNWLGILSSGMTALRRGYSAVDPRNLPFYKFLHDCMEGGTAIVSKNLEHGVKAAELFSQNTLMAAATVALAATLMIWIVRQMLQPNQLVADNNGIGLGFSLGWQRLPLGGVRWTDLEQVNLENSKSGASQVSFVRKDSSKWKLNLSAIPSDYRPLVIKRIERYAIGCQIDEKLAESMIPKSNQNYTELWLQSLSQPSERKTMELLESGHSLANGRFDVVSRLGVGGQGTAYLCTDNSGEKGQQVVLKETLLPLFVDQAVRRKAVEKFDAEAKLLQSLDNKGVVKLLDHFIEDQRSYLVLEYCTGKNLRDHVASYGAMSEEQVRELAWQMLSILEFLHENGVVHRDFTPDNLILGADNQLKLIDFNVAQQQQTKSSGTIVGKHAYLPPEQFRGKATTQSDIYAFGASLFYLLTGEDPEPISQSAPIELRPELSTDLNDVVFKATCLEPSRRFATVNEIKEALHVDTNELGEKITVSLKQGEKVLG